MVKQAATLLTFLEDYSCRMQDRALRTIAIAPARFWGSLLQSPRHSA